MSDEKPGWWKASNGRWYPPDAKPASPLPPPPEGEAPRVLVQVAVYAVLLLLAGLAIRAVLG